MLDFEIQKSTRHCAQTDRELKPGEVFYSTLVPEGEQVLRRDYCEQAWKGPPETAIGWWKSKVPDPTANRVQWAPNDVMLHYFTQLEGPETGDTRYVLTLLMIRRRVFRLEDTESDEQGRELLVVYCPRNEIEYRVPVVTPSPDRVAQIQEELARLLFASAA